MKSEITFVKVILSAVYGMVCFFVLGIFIHFTITYMHTYSFDVSYEDIYKIFIMSCIAGGAATVGSWIFAKIDGMEKSNKPPSSPKS